MSAFRSRVRRLCGAMKFTKEIWFGRFGAPDSISQHPSGVAGMRGSASRQRKQAWCLVPLLSVMVIRLG